MSEAESPTPDESPPVVIVDRTGEGTDWVEVVTGVALSLVLAPIPGGSALQKVIEAIVHRQRNRASQMAIEIADMVGGADLLLNRIEDSPELRDLLARSLEAAVRSSYEAKRKLLVRAVGNAFDNDEAVDPANLTVMALSQLEPVHIRALARLVRVATDSDLSSDEQARHNALGIASDAEPTPVCATLIQTGVVIPSTMVIGGAVRIFDVSTFGHQIIHDLREAGDDSL